MRQTLLLTLILAVAWGNARAESQPDSAAPPPSPHSALRLTIGDYGVCFGNAPRVHGLRFNLSDHGLERVDGLNITFWKPRDNPAAVINGAAVGLIAPAANCINGLSVGGIAVVGEAALRGISVATIAAVSEGAVEGVSAAGIAVVGEKSITGLSLAGVAVVSEGHVAGVSTAGLATVGRAGLIGVHAGGLAVVSEGDAVGISAGGLAAVSEGGIHGIAAGGLATVSEGEIHGIAAGGLAVVSQAGITGVTLSGIATVCEGNYLGIALSGGAIVCEEMIRGLSIGVLALPSRIKDKSSHWSLPGTRAHDIWGLAIHGMNIQVAGRTSGITISGIHLSADVISGLSVAPWTRAGDIKGIAAGVFNNVTRRQTGIVIGLFNRAVVLRGIQIGLLNYAGNNIRGLRLLPGVNVHL